MQYYDNIFYQAVGVSPVVLGGSAQFTEASSKVGLVSWMMPYLFEQRLLEQDLWNQLGIKITFNKPPSLLTDMQMNESANTGQLSFQPNETQAQVGRNE